MPGWYRDPVQVMGQHHVAAALKWVRGFACTSETLKRLDPIAEERALGRLREALAAQAAMAFDGPVMLAHDLDRIPVPPRHPPATYEFPRD